MILVPNPKPSPKRCSKTRPKHKDAAPRPLSAALVVKAARMQALREAEQKRKRARASRGESGAGQLPNL